MKQVIVHCLPQRKNKTPQTERPFEVHSDRDHYMSPQRGLKALPTKSKEVNEDIAIEPI